MTKDDFKNLLDEITDGTGFDLNKVQKGFAYIAAIKYHESKVKTLGLFRQRELLINFLAWHDSENLGGYLPGGIKDRVDEYIKLINCG